MMLQLTQSISNTPRVLDETPLLTRQLVLIGGGHAHVAVLKSFGMNPLPGLRIILISDHRDSPYSGMLPGHIAGHYDRDEAYLDLNRLARFARADFYCDRVAGLDLERKEVLFGDRPPVSFDYLSINTGSTPAMGNIPGASEHALAVKPIEGFLNGWNQLMNDVRTDDRDRKIVTVGGGAAGVELTFSAQFRLQEIAKEAGTTAPQFEIITATSNILESHNNKVQRTLRELCRGRGINIRCNEKVSSVERGVAKTEGGESVAFDVLFWTTHASAPEWIANSGLQINQHGFVQVDKRLASLSHDFVFAAGDVADLTESPRPKSGVFAARQGPPLAQNLRLVALGFPPKRVGLQKSFLSLISTGDKNAVASKGPWGTSGRWVWNWKQRIDVKWMRQYRELPEMKTAGAEMDFASRAKTNLRIEDQEAEEAKGKMRCGGCGAKVSALVLHQALKRIDPGTHPSLEIGLNAPDDATVISPPPGKLLVQSVDFFRAFVNDPYLFGRIAANHALNDLFAMGADPANALVTATVPFNGNSIIAAQLSQLLGGVVQQLKLHNAALAGGHTAEGKELAVGLTVNGFVDPHRVFKKTGLRAGDQLILTKPIGTGVVLAADMQNKASAADVQSTIDSMLRSNRLAAEIFSNLGVKACTDVSGFGLVGHLREMFGSDERLVKLSLEQLPLLPGARALAETGIASSMKSANAQNQTLLNWAEPDAAWSSLVFDPQTSGGLLAAVGADGADELIAELREAGFVEASVIGEVEEGRSARPILIERS